MDGFIDVNEVFNNVKHEEFVGYNSSGIDKKHRWLCSTIKQIAPRIKKDREGQEFYAVLPEEFENICFSWKLDVKQTKSELRKGGYLYIGMTDEYTRNCRVDGKQRRCMCIYV